MTVFDRLTDRARGVLIGQACGDALGAQVEFKQRGTFKTPKNFEDGGPHNLKAGQWTDDTAMALALADFLIARETEPGDLMDKWVAWADEGIYSCTGRCFDIGNRTRAAINHWANHNVSLHPDDQNTFADGNGAVMRVSPVAIRFWASPVERREIAEWQGSLTHGRLAAKSAAAIADAIAMLMIGKTRKEAVAVAADQLENTGFRHPRSLRIDSVESGGHTLDTTEAALWCLLQAKDPEDVILRAVELGEDSDTTAAVAGALAGAWGGYSSLPKRWTNRVAWKDDIILRADMLLEGSK